jgi:hypothetical protein
MYILQYQSYPIDIPTIKYFHNYMVWTCKYASHQSYSPLDRQLDDHALTTHTYQSVKVIDPCITTQVDGIHTISRRMDDETKTNKAPKLVFLVSHLRVLIWAKGCDHWHTYKNNFQSFNPFYKQILLFLNTRTMCLMLNYAPVPAVTEPTKL